MKLLVTGASSFVGAWFCALAAREHQVIALYNRTPVKVRGVEPLEVDLSRSQAAGLLEEQGADAVVHLACKVQGTGNGQVETDAMRLNRKMMGTVLALGLPTVYASSTCVNWPQVSGYALGRREDEQRLADSGIPYATLRICAPYGPPLPLHRPSHRESFDTLARLVRRAPVVPVIGNGRYLRQPIHVDDFNGAILALLERGLPSRAFEAGGADALSFDAIVDTMAAHLGKRARKLHVPKRLLIRALSLSPDFDPDLLDTADTDDVADPTELAVATGLRPRSFAEGVGDLYRRR